MKNVRQTQINAHRDAWVEINLDSISHNIQEFRKNIPADKKILGVVKADAYGHGSIMSAPIMLASGVDMLGVASIDEGLDLRNERISCEILVVGAVPVWSFEVAVQNDISISIFSEAHLNACKQAFERTGIKPKVHIKLDTGMNRIGLSCKEAIEFIKKVQASDFVDLKGVFTHLANAEDVEKTKKQLKIWTEIISYIDTKGLLLHALNTAGSMKYCDEIESNMVRMGIAIYGLEPDLPDELSFKPNLKQVIGLKGRITNIHTMKKGEGISYGYSYVADKDVKVATIPIGYADGVSRALSNKIYALLNGKKIKQIGNITMDQMMFDISDVEANEGDIITLLNDSDEDLSIDNWAKIVGTINYELTCRLKVRLPRVYVR